MNCLHRNSTRTTPFSFDRSLTPRVVSFTTPKNAESFTKDAPASKAGATVTYGPFNDIPPSTSHSFLEKYQERVTVHYHHEQPVLEVVKLKRTVEISHWGANLNTEDNIVLHNAGPK